MKSEDDSKPMAEDDMDEDIIAEESHETEESIQQEEQQIEADVEGEMFPNSSLNQDSLIDLNEEPNLQLLTIMKFLRVLPLQVSQ